MNSFRGVNIECWNPYKSVDKISNGYRNTHTKAKFNQEKLYIIQNIIRDNILDITPHGNIIGIIIIDNIVNKYGKNS